MLSSSIYRSTAYHSAISRAKAAKHARADQSATTQAKQTELARASMPSSMCSSLSVFSKPTKKSKSDRPNKKKRNISSWSMIREGCAFMFFQSQNVVRYNIHSSFSFVNVRMIHACGVRVVFLEHGVLGICKSSACTYNHGHLSRSFTLFCFTVINSLRARVAG